MSLAPMRPPHADVWTLIVRCVPDAAAMRALALSCRFLLEQVRGLGAGHAAYLRGVNQMLWDFPILRALGQHVCDLCGWNHALTTYYATTCLCRNCVTRETVPSDEGDIMAPSDEFGIQQRKFIVPRPRGVLARRATHERDLARMYNAIDAFAVAVATRVQLTSTFRHKDFFTATANASFPLGSDIHDPAEVDAVVNRMLHIGRRDERSRIAHEVAAHTALVGDPDDFFSEEIAAPGPMDRYAMEDRVLKALR